MKKYKKFIYLCLVAIFLIVLISCSNETKIDTDMNSNNSETNNDFRNDDSFKGDLELINDSKSINLDLKTTIVNEVYYKSIDAGAYKGTDLSNELETYFREFHTYDDFHNHVENANVINEQTFEDNYILLIKRVDPNPPAGIGYREYDSTNKSIILDVYPEVGGDAIPTTVVNYLIIPRELANSADRPQSNTGEINIFKHINCFYEMKRSQINVNQEKFAKYFENIDLANEFLKNKNINEFSKQNFDDSGILLLCLEHSLEFYFSNDRSFNLGFKNFNTNGENVYVTLERNILNGNYENIVGTYIYCIKIPNEEIHINVKENPNIHILVQDNVIETIHNKD